MQSYNRIEAYTLAVQNVIEVKIQEQLKKKKSNYIFLCFIFFEVTQGNISSI